MLPIEALKERIGKSELGQEWISNPLLNQDIWALTDLGYTTELLKMNEICNIYFEGFSLPWLKLLAKLTALASTREKCSLSTVGKRVCYLKQLDQFLVAEGYTQPELLTDSVLQKFIITGSKGVKKNRKSTIAYITKLWAEEQWLKLFYTPTKYRKETPKIEVIPEEVLHKIYENFDLFPPPLERLFRLQFVLGCRIGEMLKMPRQCLKREGKQWFLLRWIQKRKHWKFYQIHSAVAELVREQQNFLDKQFGSDSDFDKLFCQISASRESGSSQKKRFDAKPVYSPKIVPKGLIPRWLCDFSKKANLTDKQGKRFKLTSHKFRRTKATIMAYCETEDEYIAAILGHGSLDMLPHYRKRSLERLEKEANTKGYVDKYGRITTFKPRKSRYEKLAEIIEPKVSTSLGRCHRPLMLGDCQYRYGCLGCDHHRVTLEDEPKLESDIKCLKQDLKQAQTAGQERRITEINRLLELLNNRLQGLEKLKKIKKKNYE